MPRFALDSRWYQFGPSDHRAYGDTTTQSLAGDKDIGLNSEQIARPEGATPGQPCLNFVHDEKHLLLAADALDFPVVLLGKYDVAVRALDDFHQQRSHLPKTRAIQVRF